MAIDRWAVIWYSEEGMGGDIGSLLCTRDGGDRVAKHGKK